MIKNRKMDYYSVTSSRPFTRGEMSWYICSFQSPCELLCSVAQVQIRMVFILGLVIIYDKYLVQGGGYGVYLFIQGNST